MAPESVPDGAGGLRYTPRGLQDGPRWLMKPPRWRKKPLRQPKRPPRRLQIGSWRPQSLGNLWHMIFLCFILSVVENAGVAPMRPKMALRRLKLASRGPQDERRRSRRSAAQAPSNNCVACPDVLPRSVGNPGPNKTKAAHCAAKVL